MFSAFDERIALGRKALALLAYLEVEPHAHSRQQLSALLWSESDEIRAAMSLRQALRKLRDVLGPRVVADRNSVALETSSMAALTCDVTTFSMLIDSDAMAATDVDVSSFLASLQLVDAPQYEHWIDRTRARLVRQAVDALKTDAQRCAAKRDWARVAQVAERWQSLDPLSQAAASAAIEAAYMRRDADRGRALYAAFCAERRAAGQAPPGDAMQSLLQRLESLSAVLAPVHGSTAVRTDAATPHLQFLTSLHEREDVWQAIVDRYDAAEREQRAQIVMLRSAAGQGRSRLLQDTAAWMASRGATVLSAQLSESGMSLPYGAVGALVRTAIDAPALGGIDGVYLRELVQLVPEMGARFPGVVRGATSTGIQGWTLLEALVQALRALAEDAPLILALDDVTWCDRESAAVLQAAIDQVEQVPIVWLSTGAEDDLPFAASTLPAHMSARGTVLPLAPLSVDAVVGMLDEFAGEDGDWEALAARLHAASHGVPALLHDVVEMLLTRENARWSHIRHALVTVPLLPARIARRLDLLSDMEREVLLALSLVMEDGHPLPLVAWNNMPALAPHQLSHVHGISRLRAARVGEALVDARFAVVANGGFRCAAPVVAEHMLTHGSAIMRDELRRRLRHVQRMPRRSRSELAAVATAEPNPGTGRTT